MITFASVEGELARMIQYTRLERFLLQPKCTMEPLSMPFSRAYEMTNGRQA